MPKKSIPVSIILIAFILIVSCALTQEKIASEVPIIQPQDNLSKSPDDYSIKEMASEENTEIENGHNQEYEKSSPKSRPAISVLHTRMEGCQEKDVVFTHLPLDIENVKAVEPQGELTNSGHVTPGDHGGFQYDSKGPKINVYAMADGYIKRVERNRPFRDLKSKNYHLYIEFSCSMFASYVHVTEIAPEMLEADPDFKRLDSMEEVPDNERSIWPNIPIKAGQIIGKAHEWGLLGMLAVDTDVKLKGFANPDKYKGEDWKIHAVPPFGYFTPELKAQLMDKNPRKKSLEAAR